jgi:hypothetical protein
MDGHGEAHGYEANSTQNVKHAGKMMRTDEKSCALQTLNGRLTAQVGNVGSHQARIFVMHRLIS